MRANPLSKDGRTASILETLQPESSTAAYELLSTAPEVELPGGTVRSVSSLPGAKVVVVEEGFVVLRATDPAARRRVVICHGGPGTLLPFSPSSHDIVALVDSRLTVITEAVYERLLELPDAAQALPRGIEAIVCQ
jgi:hypothetical protein